MLSCVASKTRRQKVSEHGLRSMPRFFRKAITFAEGYVRTRTSAVIWALNWGVSNSVDQNDIGRSRHRSGCIHDAGVFSATCAAVTTR